MFAVQADEVDAIERTCHRIESGRVDNEVYVVVARRCTHTRCRDALDG